MADSRSRSKTNEAVAATPEAVAADAAAAAPQQDELQKRREAVAEAGLAHGSMNAGVPFSKDEYSDAEVQGDTVKLNRPDNVSEQTKRANKANDEAQGVSASTGQPAVGSSELREPGVADSKSATANLPEDDSTPKKTVKGSADDTAPKN